jgi:hypothetical protein
MKISASINRKTLNLELASKKVIEANRKGMGQAGLRMIRDFVIDTPTPPVRTGFLRGSGSTFIGSNLVGTSKDLGFNGGEPNTQYNAPDDTITVGFNARYAAAQDQNLAPEGNWMPSMTQDTTIGGGFVTKKLTKKYWDVWIGIIAKAIKDASNS